MRALVRPRQRRTPLRLPKRSKSSRTEPSRQHPLSIPLPPSRPRRVATCPAPPPYDRARPSRPQRASRSSPRRLSSTAGAAGNGCPPRLAASGSRGGGGAPAAPARRRRSRRRGSSACSRTTPTRHSSTCAAGVLSWVAQKARRPWHRLKVRAPAPAVY